MEAFLLKALPFGEFTANVVMCGFIIALYYKFTGQFSVQDVKIEGVEKTAASAEEKSKYALKASKKALKASASSLKYTKQIERTVKKIHTKVDNISKDYKQYTEGKNEKYIDKGTIIE